MAVQKQTWDQQPAESWADTLALRVATEIRRVRGKRSVQWLADETTRLGHAMTHGMLSDVETGRRRYVTIAEICVIAAALRVPPLSLIFPGPYSEGVDVLPHRQVTQGLAAAWFDGGLEVDNTSQIAADFTETIGTDYFLATRPLRAGRAAIAVEGRRLALIDELRRLRERRDNGDTTITDDEIEYLAKRVADARRMVESLAWYGTDSDPAIYWEGVESMGIPRLVWDLPPDLLIKGD